MGGKGAGGFSETMASGDLYVSIARRFIFWKVWKTIDAEREDHHRPGGACLERALPPAIWERHVWAIPPVRLSVMYRMIVASMAMIEGSLSRVLVLLMLRL